MKMSVDEAIHQILAAVITVKMLAVMDKIAGDNPVYHLTRPLLVSSLLCSAYRSIKVDREAVQ
jgi:hypothetical protein